MQSTHFYFYLQRYADFYIFLKSVSMERIMFTARNMEWEFRTHNFEKFFQNT